MLLMNSFEIKPAKTIPFQLQNDMISMHIFQFRNIFLFFRKITSQKIKVNNSNYGQAKIKGRVKSIHLKLE